MAKENLLISACLSGSNTKYNGGNNYHAIVEKLKERYNLIIVCPEVLGGLTIPRRPSEIKDNKVYMNDLTEVTKNFEEGAKKALDMALKYNCKIALLKEKSPSCGVKYIYDGTFTATIKEGQGFTAKLLNNNGIKLYNELEIEELLS